jgi:hypothetical protein
MSFSHQNLLRPRISNFIEIRYINIYRLKIRDINIYRLKIRGINIYRLRILYLIKFADLI